MDSCIPKEEEEEETRCVNKVHVAVGNLNSFRNVIPKVNNRFMLIYVLLRNVLYNNNMTDTLAIFERPYHIIIHF